MPIKSFIAEWQNEIIAWRHDFHQHPELMFDTKRTGHRVAALLRQFNCDEVVTGMAQHGVVGVINGKTNTSGRVIGLRADMDALPIAEATGVNYASCEAGKMHACGHDGHMAMLLGAAKYLSEMRNFDGQLVVIFQPAEEGGGGGQVMCQEGLMERFGIDEIYGMHNMPGLPVGEFAIRPGAFFAATDQFDLKIIGRGGHAAMPHKTIDPTVCAAQMIMALQTIVSRNADPLQQLVVSVCSIETDSQTHNVIPAQVLLRGTVRTLNAQMRDLAEQRVNAVAESTAAAFGTTVELQYTRGYPVMVNADQETHYAAEAAAVIAGKPTPCNYPPTMGGEDFAYMLEQRPGSYILLGNGDTPSLHHPEYNFNDQAIPYGVAYWVELSERRLPLISA